MIANIFGMHIGCEISFKLKIETLSAQLAGVFKGRGTGRYMVKTHDDFNIYLEDCKLILTSLSKITEEDKAELRKYCEDNSILPDFGGLTEKSILYLKNDRVYVSYRKGKELALSFKVCMRLAKMGYDIGICPEENKIVEVE